MDCIFKTQSHRKTENSHTVIHQTLQNIINQASANFKPALFNKGLLRPIDNHNMNEISKQLENERLTFKT